ncbi:MAG: hypothetical protein QG602_2802 [Verrucomicrobiota bacterium]|nr:hypothetical protein [Verrucomicrobiota bacterium]
MAHDTPLMSSATPAVLDARLIPCSGKHELIFRRWAALQVGENFVLLNDHRPEPLRRQFEQLVPDCYEWREIEPPAGAFAVRLTRLQPDPAGLDLRRVSGCGLRPAPAEGDNPILVQLQFDYRDLAPEMARATLLRFATDLPEGTELLAVLRQPDPELDHGLTALNRAFRGEALPAASPGWRYSIRHPD